MEKELIHRDGAHSLTYYDPYGPLYRAEFITNEYHSPM